MSDEKGYRIVYAKNCGRPKNIFLETKFDVIEFFLENLNEIDMMSINDVYINRQKLVNDNKKLSRYLKLRKITDSI